jgi:fibronectin type 3 domain-containing protein
MAHSAVLTWQAPTTGDAVQNYNVQRAPVIGGVTGTFATIASPTATTYTDLAVIAGNSYQYRVASVNSAGESAFVTSTVQLIPLAIPGVPTSLTVVVS